MRSASVCLAFGRRMAAPTLTDKEAGALGEAEQAFDGTEPARLGGGGQGGQAVLVVLQVAQGDLAERGGDHRPEGGQVGRVGALGGRAAPVQPERHQPGVGCRPVRAGSRPAAGSAASGLAGRAGRAVSRSSRKPSMPPKPNATAVFILR